MKMSTWAFNRIAEQQFAGDKARLDALRAKGKVLLMDVREMQDENILEKLNSIGLRIDKEVISEQCLKHTSAEDLAKWLEKDRKLKNFNEDLTWLGIRVLWERWFPEIPNFEILDDKMQEGYKLRAKSEVLKVWGDTWDIIKEMMDRHGVTGLMAFDDLFSGTQSIFNWSMDYEMELSNASIENLDFAQKRVDFCTEFIERYEDKNDQNIKVMMRSVGDAYFRMGNTEKGEELFAGYLMADPTWGWGWITWSDQYHLFGKYDDTDKAIDILKRGLKVKNLKDREYVLERLHDIYTNIGRDDEAKNIMKEMKQVEEAEDYNKNLPSAVGNKVGRNDPCPCGSGKKYKKCCGK